MKKARVLEIVGKRPVGGVGTVMLNYQQHMNPKKVQIDYLIFGEQPEAFDEAVKKLGSKIYCFPALSGRQMGTTKRMTEAFFKEHEGEYDVVHLHAPYIAGIVLKAAKKHGIQHRIVHSHATLYAESKGKAIRNRILWKVSQGDITERIGCSKAAGDFLFGKKDYIVLKNAIAYENYLFDQSTREQIRSREGIAENQLVIGNVGRFSRQKNQIFLIDIFAEIKKMRPDAVLWLMGDGELREQIEHAINEYGFSVSCGEKGDAKSTDIRLWGMLSHVKNYYSAMDVMAMPSLFEGLPMVGVEAQASGLPCVYSDTITREVDVVGCAYLSLQNSTKEWAETIIFLAEEKKKGNARLRSYAKELDELGFNIHLEAERLTDFYNALADSKEK